MNHTRQLITVAIAGMLLLAVRAAPAQCTFTSGSTGSDGTLYLSPSATNAPAGTIFTNTMLNGQGYHLAEVPLPRKGIFNFSSVYVETNWAVSFKKNAANTPVYILATTDVVIYGSIMITGGAPPAAVQVMGGAGGPGGYPGGNGQIGGFPETAGGGPGGFRTNSSGGFGTYGVTVPEDPVGADGDVPDPIRGGFPYGTANLKHLIGGSGGSGSSGGCSIGGGGGGGAILIASSSVIDIEGEINADGGIDGQTVCTQYGGSGGAIHLVAPTIQGEGTIHALGGGALYAAQGAVGRIRIDGCNFKRVSMSSPPNTFGLPTTIFPSSPPSIQITSIAGTGTPSSPTGSLANADMFLPGAFTNPATFSVTASNINLGTEFSIIITPANGSNLVGNGTLSSGYYAISTGSVTMDVYTDQIWRVDAIINYVPTP